jgi:chemotaxis protein histidine kinase CheA
MHEREQIACATLASLQDEIQRVKGSLHRAQEGLAKALEAKEKLPGAIKQAAIEADRAKAEAEVSKEQVRKAKHEAEQERAATSTAMSRQAAALKEAEAARASEAMAMAELKALTESESHYNAARASKGTGMAEPKAEAESESHYNAEAEPESKSESESESGSRSKGIISITLEEYTSLKRAADAAESAAEKRVLEVAALVEDAKARQSAAQMRLANMAMEVEACRAELDAARKRGEEAQEAKLASEAALRRWRAEHEQLRLQKQSGNLNAHGAPLAAGNAHNGGGDDDDAGDLAAMKIVTDFKGRERRGAGLDSFSQVLSLKVPITSSADAANHGKVLPIVESVSLGNEKLDKKKKMKKKPSLLKRLASVVLRKKAPVVT